MAARARGSRRGERKATNAGKPDVAKAADLRVLARDAALAALHRLAELSRSEDERVALAATQELLNRAFGKAQTAGAEEVPAAQQLVVKIVRFSELEESAKAKQEETQ